MIKLKSTYLFFFLLPCLIPGCRSGDPANGGAVGAMHFTLLEAGETNIHFNNEISESDSINIFINEYMYNGSGVGIGDFNNDGLPDIYFGGSMVSSRLYINKGNFRFEDITDKAGVGTNRWCTGISVVDINNDGYMDIYVCASHSILADKRRNQLFINDGHLHFTDQAAEYGLADTGYATQAAFFDYDRDGDLDMYLLNHRLYSHTANTLQPKDTSGNSPAQDRLYRNEGVLPGTSHPVFRDVTLQARIKEDGYGLGVVITDVNNDNRPDIYVANDYIANDLLWLNNGNGTFSNIISTALKHQSYNSMGVDAADINNDGLPDLMTVDMMPETNQRKKMMLSSTNQEKFDMQQRLGYESSFMRNMLQLNNGERWIDNRSEPFYSEIGQMAGVFETDWSWSVLMADFDNDGWKDIHITNGLGKDVTNNDYASFRNEQTNLNNYTFGGDATQKTLDASKIKTLRKEIDVYGSIKMNSYFFHNNSAAGGGMTFSDEAKQAGLQIPAISNGAAYADLDNDGDLDLVVNNINQTAFVWRNEARQSIKDTAHNFLTIQLQGPAANPAGIGCKVTLYSKSVRQFLEQSPVRGFSSSVDQRLHFGTGSLSMIDSLQILWPDSREQWIKNVSTDQQLTVKYQDANPGMRLTVTSYGPLLFDDVSGQSGISFKHSEKPNYDFGSRQPLSQMYSQMGPCLATADVNGDGLTDFFVGGGANQSGRIFIQQFDEQFVAQELVQGTKTEEDLGAIFFDADGDKDADLLVTGGSLEFGTEKYNQPRLYINDGKGNFKLDADALPVITDITKAVTVADYDGDGDLDIFIGGRLLPKKYPQSPRSYLLQNEHGKFKDVTKNICPSLEFAGLITGALFMDFNNDQKPDLVICGEWMEIRFFRNENNTFKEVTDGTGLTAMHGMWRSLQQADIDGDGDMDYIAGNLGINNKYHEAPGRPMWLFAKDVDKNGFDELIPAYYIKGRNNSYELYPALDRNEMAEQVPGIKKKYLLHRDYADVSMDQLKNDFGEDGWTILKCETFTTCWIENLGEGKFRKHELPPDAQLAPVNAIVSEDIDRDGHIDIVIAGNEYGIAVNTGRYDASWGTYLKGIGKGNFVAVKNEACGLIIDGDIKDLKMVTLKNGNRILLAAPNDSQLKTFILHSTVK